MQTFQRHTLLNPEALEHRNLLISVLGNLLPDVKKIYIVIIKIMLDGQVSPFVLLLRLPTNSLKIACKKAIRMRN